MITTMVIVLLAWGGLLLAKGIVWGGYLLGIAAIMFGLGLKNIPALPPSKGLVTIWGTRVKCVISEGYTILAPYFPFFYDAIIINVEQKNQNFTFSKIRCNAVPGMDFQSGAAVTVNVGVTWAPDVSATGLYNYIGVGTEQGTWDILRDMMAEAIREYAVKKTWEELTQSGADLAKALLKKLTDREGNPVSTRGYKDILGLGITITRLNIGEIVPEGQVMIDAEKRAANEHKRRAENYELDTDFAQANKLKEAYDTIGEPRTLEDCLLEVRRRRAIREGHGKIVDIPGVSELAGKLFK